MKFLKHLAQSIDAHPQRRLEGALNIARDALEVESMVITVVPPKSAPQIVAEQGYVGQSASAFTATRWFQEQPHRHQRELKFTKRPFDWDNQEFLQSEAAREVLEPAGYRDGISVPLLRPDRKIFGYVHANTMNDRLPTSTDTFFEEIRDYLTDSAHSIYDRMNSGLTPRELEILALLREGLSTPGIAERLFISQRTASTHIDRILRKTCSNNRVQAAIWAVHRGI